MKSLQWGWGHPASRDPKAFSSAQVKMPRKGDRGPQPCGLHPALVQPHPGFRWGVTSNLVNKHPPHSTQHTHTHLNIQTHKHITHMHTHMCMHLYTHCLTHRHTPMHWHVCMGTLSQADTRTHMLTHPCACTCPCTHAHRSTYTHMSYVWDTRWTHWP